MACWLATSLLVTLICEYGNTVIKLVTLWQNGVYNKMVLKVKNVCKLGIDPEEVGHTRSASKNIYFNCIFEIPKRARDSVSKWRML